MNDSDFKDALGQWPSGVSAVLTKHNGLVDGITASSFTSVSLDPPLVLVSIDNRSSQLQRLAVGQPCTVNILGCEQASVSNFFANPHREPQPTLDGFPFTVQPDLGIDGANAQLFCSVHNHTLAGDHTLVLLSVKRAITADTSGASEPLVYWFRKYRRMAQPEPT